MKTKNKVNKKNNKNRNLFGNKLLIGILLFSTIFCVVYIAFIKKKEESKKERIIREIKKKMEKGDDILREKHIRNTPYTRSKTYVTPNYTLELEDNSKLIFQTEDGIKALVMSGFGTYQDQKITITNTSESAITLKLNVKESVDYQIKINIDGNVTDEIDQIFIHPGDSLSIFIVVNDVASIEKTTIPVTGQYIYWEEHNNEYIVEGSSSSWSGEQNESKKRTTTNTMESVDIKNIELSFYNSLKIDGSLVISGTKGSGENITNKTIPLYTRGSQTPNLTDINQIKNDVNAQYDSLDNTIPRVREGGWDEGYWKSALNGEDANLSYNKKPYSSKDDGGFESCGQQIVTDNYIYRSYNKVFDPLEEGGLTGTIVFKEYDKNPQPDPDWLTRKSTTIDPKTVEGPTVVIY